MDQRVQHLLAQAVPPGAVRVVGAYTSPHTWGVYEVEPGSGSGRRFRKGNHPVRLRELEREFGKVRTLGLFTAEAQALELAQLLNGNASRVA